MHRCEDLCCHLCHEISGREKPVRDVITRNLLYIWLNNSTMSACCYQLNSVTWFQPTQPKKVSQEASSIEKVGKRPTGRHNCGHLHNLMLFQCRCTRDHFSRGKTFAVTLAKCIKFYGSFQRACPPVTYGGKMTIAPPFFQHYKTAVWRLDL